MPLGSRPPAQPCSSQAPQQRSAVPAPPIQHSPSPSTRSAPLLDGLVRQRLEQRQQVQQVVDGAPAVLVGRPVAHRQRQPLALRLELVDLAGGGRGWMV